MHVLNSSGRQVSLLNEEPARSSFLSSTGFHRPSFSRASPVISRPYMSARRGSSASETPELLRSDSYDSHGTDPASPLTPLTACDYAVRTYDYPALEKPSHKRHAGSFDDDDASAPATERASGKRYPCRYRHSHGCDKTFTTSGHASRHSKIHTAEKAVHCTYTGCTKKFTRADNMKQHLETHFKDRSSRPSKSAAASGGHGAHGGRRPSAASSRTNSTSSLRPPLELQEPRVGWDIDPYSAPPLPSPGPSPGIWGGGDPGLSPFRNRPVGLDALAIACQQEAESP